MEQGRRNVEFLCHLIIVALHCLLSFSQEHVSDFEVGQFLVFLEGAETVITRDLYLFLNFSVVFGVGKLLLLIDDFGDHVEHVLNHRFCLWCIDNAENFLGLFMLIECKKEVT